MIPIYPPQPNLRATVSQSLPTMPTSLVSIIMDYAATKNYTVLRDRQIRFDSQGRVRNPEVREVYKEVLMSSYCDPIVKSWVMYRIFHPRFADNNELLLNEARLIFDEIATAGYRVILDHVALDDLLIQFVNWTGISLDGACLTGAQLNHVEMSHASLTNLNVDCGEWTDVNAQYTDLSGTNLNQLYIAQHINLSGAVGVAHEPQPFITCPATEPHPSISAAVAQSLEDMPGYVLDTISGYLASTEYWTLEKYQISFDDTGRVNNPEVRQAYKDAFMSTYCSGKIKTALICKLFAAFYPVPTKTHELLAEEGRKIFNEIVAEGYHADLNDITLREIRLSSINWAGASLVHSRLYAVSLVNVDMRNANARDMRVKDGEWIEVNVALADFTGAVLDNVWRVTPQSLVNVIGEPRIT